MKNYFAPVLVSCSLFLASAALSGEVIVENARIVGGAGGVYSFHVTLRHADTGWEHYEDKWEVVDKTGKILGERVLLHPHVNEQPFTRSLSGVRIPKGTTSVTIRAHDKKHGYGGHDLTLPVAGAGG